MVCTVVSWYRTEAVAKQTSPGVTTVYLDSTTPCQFIPVSYKCAEYKYNNVNIQSLRHIK